MFSRLSNIVRRHWSERGGYRTSGDCWMSIYNRLLIHMPRLPLPGRKTIRGVAPSSLAGSLHVRLGSSDWYVLEEIFLHGEYDAVTSSLTGLRTIVDLGANVGMSVRLWQERYPDARIVAVEPDPANLEMARRNALSREPGVAFVHGCVAGRHRQVALDRSRDEYSFRMSDAIASSGSGTVAAYTLPEILSTGGFGPDEPIDLLKCDIEGAEAELFADCASWIGRVQNLVIELHAPYTTEKFVDDLRRNGSPLAVVDEQLKGDLSVLRLTAVPASTVAAAASTAAAASA